MRQSMRFLQLLQGSICNWQLVVVVLLVLPVGIEVKSVRAAAALSADEQTLLEWRSSVLSGRSDLGERPCGWQFVTCSATGNVVEIALPNSNLTGRIADLRLGTLTSLEKLDFTINFLEGPLPEDIANCRMLKKLFLSTNRLSGPIPASLGLLTLVEEIDLSINLFNGTIPPELGNCSSLLELKLYQNQLTGYLPADLGKLSTLSVFTVRANQLTGSLPPELGNWGKLIFLGLSENPFTGPIPATLGKLSLLITMSIHHTSLSGEIPPELGNLMNLIYMLIQENELTGVIPDLENCKSLEYLNVSHNHLSGPIPSSLVDLQFLDNIDVSYNNLTGSVPTELANMPKFVSAGNPGLIGVSSSSLTASAHKPKRLSTGSIVGVVLAAIAVLLSICALISYKLLRRKKTSLVQPSLDTDKLKDGVGLSFALSVLPEPDDDHFQPDAVQKHHAVTFSVAIPNARIVAVAESITDDAVIGAGGCGTVYKAVMPVTGEPVAVKKITGGSRSRNRAVDEGNEQGGSSSYGQNHISLYESYCNEIRAAGKIRHKNIVKVLGFCWNEDCNYIVYEYIANGSLADALHGGGATVLDWNARFSIALGTAQAVAYFHHDCTPRVIHRDIKSSNILLDDGMQPHVTDFGLAKLVDRADAAASLSTFTNIVGTYGYIAPEYAYTLKISEKSDVYSFGVVLMELLTGKSPIDACFVDSGLSMVTWMRKTVSTGFAGRPLTRLALDEVLDGVLDERLKGQTYVLEEELDLHRSEMAAVLAIALLCTEDSPGKRPSMRDVESQLAALRRGSSTTRSHPHQLVHMYTNVLAPP